MASTARRLAALVPEWTDRCRSWQLTTLITAPLLILFFFPTGILGSNEEYYFQIAANFMSGETPGPYEALQERSHHLFLSNFLIGIPIQLFGYEGANALLRILTAFGLAASFSWLLSSLRLSALEGLLSLAIFWLAGQQLFGGEWIFGGVEGKVFGYLFVFLGLAQSSRAQWKSAVCLFVVATYFHILVGGFWALVAFVWLWLNGRKLEKPAKAFAAYSLAVLPLAVAILLQLSASAAAVSPNVDTNRIFTTYYMAHHVAPFSDIWILWEWTDGILLAVGLLLATVLMSRLELKDSTRTLVWLVGGLLCYLLLALAASTSQAVVDVLGTLFLFRPSSLALLLAIITMFVVYSEQRASRLPVWMAAWALVPLAAWSAAKEPLEHFVGRPFDRAEAAELVDVVESSTQESEIVLMQPGADGGHLELALSRLLDRPTYQNFFLGPTAPAALETWYRRDQLRHELFENGCHGVSELDLGALIVRNPDMPARDVLDSCGRIIWSGPNYSVVAIDDTS